MTVALGAIAFKVVDTQAFGGDHYDALAMGQRTRSVSLAGERGTIFDRNGNDLAISLQRQTVFADPSLVEDPVHAAKLLAPVLRIDQRSLLVLLTQPDTSFVYLARKVDNSTAKKVRGLGIPGIGFMEESQRFNPSGQLAGPVLGFVGSENTGLGGLEAAHESWLAGKAGRVVSEADPSGRPIPATERSELLAKRGGDLVLTLDQSLQFEVESQLVAQVNATGAKGGMAVVVDIRTGDVLAMATVEGAIEGTPTQAASARARNRPLTDIYEPGSTNKVITIASALEAGIANPDTTYAVNSSIWIDDAHFEDHDPHGTMQWSVRDILRESSNVGSILIARAVGKDRLDSSLREFGFSKKTAISFPGEAEGLLLDPQDYSESSMGSVPIGLGLAVTPMQMLDVFVTLANKGVSRPPRLVAAKIDAQGHQVEIPAKRGKRVISAATAASMVDMLTGVVSGGTGKRAAVPGYTTAGKTGTARKVPYIDKKYMASFAGFAPAEAPRLAAIVVLDEPVKGYYGGEVAAPVFAKVMQYALRLEHVAPSGAIAVADSAEQDGSASNDAPPPTTVPTTIPQAPPAPPASAQARATPAGKLASPDS